MQPTAAPQLGATHWPTAFRSWMDRPAPSWTIALCIMALLALPCWLLGDQLRHFCLAGDDFAYVADSRDASRLASNLFKPHNTHVVPLFRIWTFALVKAAGRLSNFATALGVGSYLTFSLSLLAIRHLVVRVTRSQAAGLIAMAMLGLSTVMESVVVWYSAGQALCAGTSIVASLIAIESWLSQGKVWSLALAVAASLAAPGIWMGGLVAGPAAAAYLWFAGRRTSKRAAVAFLMVSVCLAGPLLASVSNEMQRLSQPADRRTGTAAKALEAVRSTCMAIPETLVFRNLGIDAPLTAPQGLVICLAIAWFWFRGGLRRPNRFEAAGAVLVVGSYLMVYFFRGYMAYEHMRVVGWYNAIPEIGAILFVAGWWARWRGSDAAEPTAEPSRWTFRCLMAVVSVTCCLLVLHLPRAAPVCRRSAEDDRRRGGPLPHDGASEAPSTGLRRRARHPPAACSVKARGSRADGGRPGNRPDDDPSNLRQGTRSRHPRASATIGCGRIARIARRRPEEGRSGHGAREPAPVHVR